MYLICTDLLYFILTIYVKRKTRDSFIQLVFTKNIDNRILFYLNTKHISVDNLWNKG